MSNEIEYGTRHLTEGNWRWAVTRNGEVITVKRMRKTAENLAEHFATFLELMGHESSMAEFYMKESGVSA